MMNLKTIVFSLVAIIALPQLAISQRNLITAKLTYSIEASGDDADKFSATQIISFNPQHSRVDFNSKIGNEATIYDNSTKKGFILKEFSGQKLMITLTQQNWQERNRVQSGLKFNVSNETFTVGEYNCKKATATYPDGSEMVVYFTPAYTLSNAHYLNSFPDLPGLPIMYTLKRGNREFKYTLTSLSQENIPSASFEAPTSGYRVLTFEESRQTKQ